MAIMEKRVLLGVQKKKPNKRNKKKLLKRVLNYLKSDCYLFASLISSSRSDSRSHKVEFKEPAKENKRLVKKVEEYLLSDCYMYAPLTVPPRSFNISSKGPSPCAKRVTVEVPSRSLNMKDNNRLANKVVEKQASKDSPPEKVIPDERSRVHKETVKHAIYRNCLSVSVSEERVIGSQLRKAL